MYQNISRIKNNYSLRQGSQTRMTSGAAYGQFNSSRAAFVQYQELTGQKSVLRRVVSTFNYTIS
jgi:hypothetical protein